MNANRIKEIQNETAYPESRSVQQALMKVWNECEQSSDTKRIVIGRGEQGQVERLIDLMITESEITTGSYFSMYFAKTRKAWVVYYGQNRKVESDSLFYALKNALENLIGERNAITGHEFTLYN